MIDYYEYIFGEVTNQLSRRLTATCSDDKVELNQNGIFCGKAKVGSLSTTDNGRKLIIELYDIGPDGEIWDEALPLFVECVDLSGDLDLAPTIREVGFQINAISSKLKDWRDTSDEVFKSFCALYE